MTMTLSSQTAIVPETNHLAQSGKFRTSAERTRLSRFAVLLLVLSTAGCEVGPDFSAPARPTEQAYVTNQAIGFGSADPGEAQQRLAMGEKLRADWWALLQSAELDQIVQLALANNYSIEIARMNLAKASEGVTAAQGGLYPQIDAAGGLAREQYGASFLGPEAATFPNFSAYTAGIDVSYDLDAFGGTRRKIELAAAAADVQREGLYAAQLDIAGQVVFDALQIGSINAQISVVQSILASDQQNLDLVEMANASGIASQVDVTTARSQMDSDRTLLPSLNQQLDVTRDALAVLVGKSPAIWAPPDFSLATLVLPQDIPLVVPSSLVRVRPDIGAAEAQLHAASAAVGVATADLYPHITLSADVAESGLVGGPSGAAWSLIGGLTAPIFHGGALTANRRAAQDAYQAAFAQYHQTVLASFQQVADILHGLGNAADEVETQQQALASASAALCLARLGYGAGNAGILQVIDAQRLEQLAELSLVQARTQRYILTVNLFLASGGGFK
jgi:NodT family efflux transporter outer membrane factor (OMF) lipoprotein